jgi:hypothetical protein
MFNVCRQCGQYHADKIIDQSGPFAICPECGYQHAFLQLPLFIISGASGTGKTTVLQQLLGRVADFVLLDSDILWRPEFTGPENNYHNYFETWLRVCKNISQSGRPVMLFGSGFGVPENIEPCIERRYFSQVHYLAMVCEDEALSQRLLNRSDWRHCNSEEYLKAQQNYNRWFKERGQTEDPRIDLVDTTPTSVAETADEVISWGRRTIQTK